MGTRAQLAEAATTKDGLPRKAFAYAPTNDPSTWKLPIYNADGSVDSDRLPAAAAALSEGGFRGEKADIPRDSLRNVKSKLRAAYRKWKGRDAEYPDSIKEAIFREEASDARPTVTVREATVLLDKTAVEASVIFLPNGDSYVVPRWDGQFFFAKRPFDEPELETPPLEDYSAKWDAQDAAHILSKLYDLKGKETDQPDQMALLDKAITGLLGFLKAEGDEIGQPVSEADHPLMAELAEAGRRNSSADQKRIQGVHDFVVELGAQCANPVAEAITVAGNPDDVTFRENAVDGAAVVTLAEAAPVFDMENRIVTITPIRPGWGNKRDKFYYPAAALQEATERGLFNHLKMFKNHPRRSDEKELPERSVTDWFATTQEASWDPVRQVPRLPVKIHDQEILERFHDAPEQIAFSVLGGGVARPGKVNGQDGRIVESLHHLRSVDWVTEAGAGGAIFAESAAEEFDMSDIENLTAEQLREANPTLYKELTGIKEHAEGAEHGKSDEAGKENAPGQNKAEGEPAEGKGQANAPGQNKAEGEPAPAEPAAPAPAEPAAEEPVAEGKKDDTSRDFVSRSEFEALQRKLQAPEMRKLVEAAVAAELKESTLPAKAKDAVAERFAEAGWGNGYVYTDEPALRDAVKGELAHAAKLVGEKPRQSKVTGLGPSGDEGEGEGGVRNIIESRINEKWGTEAIPARPTTVVTDGNENIAESGQDKGDAAAARIAAKLG